MARAVPVATIGGIDVGKTLFSEIGYQSIPTEGAVKNIGGDPIFIETMFSTDGSDESSRISPVDHSGTLTTLADLPGWYKSVVQWGDYFVAIAPLPRQRLRRRAGRVGAYDIPADHPYSIKKGRENPPGGNPPGKPPGRQPPNPPQPSARRARRRARTAGRHRQQGMRCVVLAQRVPRLAGAPGELRLRLDQRR